MSASRDGLLDRIDPGPVLADLRHRAVNYRADEVNRRDWAFDTWVSRLPAERPGAPEPKGSWTTACALIEAYEFSDPALVRAVYAEAAPLLGRDMLLEGRFHGLRYYMGVRVTNVVDEERSTDSGARQRVWGWAYETLDGHLERGKISYEVVKDHDTGLVTFQLQAHSQRAPTLGPITRVGWRLFGRRTQRRFYRRSGERLASATDARRDRDNVVPARRTVGGHVLAPSDARDSGRARFTVGRVHPG